METDYEQAVDKLCKDVRDLRSDIKSILVALHEGAKDKAGSTRDHVKEVASLKLDEMKQAARDAHETGVRAAREIADKIKERPVVSLLTAVGIGMIIGGMIHGRARR